MKKILGNYFRPVKICHNKLNKMSANEKKKSLINLTFNMATFTKFTKCDIFLRGYQDAILLHPLPQVEPAHTAHFSLL